MVGVFHLVTCWLMSGTIPVLLQLSFEDQGCFGVTCVIVCLCLLGAALIACMLANHADAGAYVKGLHVCSITTTIITGGDGCNMRLLLTAGDCGWRESPCAQCFDFQLFALQLMMAALLSVLSCSCTMLCCKLRCARPCAC